MMRLFVCLMDFVCNKDMKLDALQARQPYGQKYTTEFNVKAPDLASAANQN